MYVHTFVYMYIQYTNTPIYSLYWYVCIYYTYTVYVVYMYIYIYTILYTKSTLVYASINQTNIIATKLC